MATTSPDPRESTPEAPPGISTLCDAFQASVARCGDNVALRTPDDSVVISWREYGDRVRQIAAGLAAHGIAHGDTVAMMLTNRPEANLIDTAALHLGATSLSIYNTNAPNQIEYVLTDADCRLVVTERAFVDRVLAVREKLPQLEYVFVIDGASAGTSDLDELIAAGDPDFDFEASWSVFFND